MAAPDSSIEIISPNIDSLGDSLVLASVPTQPVTSAQPITPAQPPVSTPTTVATSVPTTTPSKPAARTPKSSQAKASPVKTSPAPGPKPVPRNKSPVQLLTKSRPPFREEMDNVPERPWRKTVDWNSSLEESVAQLKDEIENYEPLGDLLTDEVQFPQVNILLFGGVGAGKSSVFNTLNSTFRGKIFNVARSGCSEHSLTTKFCKYPVMSGSSTMPTPMKFKICDIRGLEQSHLMTKENMRYILEGNICDKFPFDPSGNISADMPGFTKHPDLHQKIHCVALVQDASIVDAMQDVAPDVTNNIKEMQTIMNSLDIPQVVILTKIDSICEETKYDASLTFRSPKIEKCVAKISEVLGLPRNSIFPMKNYEMEYQLDPAIDIVALLTLKGILNNCDAHLFTHYDEIIKNYKVT